MKPKAPKFKRMKPSRKDRTHLDDIRQLSCILSGRPAEAAHLRFADPRHGKPMTGLGQKPHDRFTLPLAPELHRLFKGCQHDSGDELAWWQSMGIADPVAIALRLYGKSRIEMERIITMSQPWDPAIKARIAAVLKGTAGHGGEPQGPVRRGKAGTTPTERKG